MNNIELNGNIKLFIILRGQLKTMLTIAVYNPKVGNTDKNLTTIFQVTTAPLLTFLAHQTKHHLKNFLRDYVLLCLNIHLVL